MSLVGFAGWFGLHCANNVNSLLEKAGQDLTQNDKMKIGMNAAAACDVSALAFITLVCATICFCFSIINRKNKPNM